MAEVMCQVTKNDIPRELVQRLTAEKQVMPVKQKSVLVNVRLLLEDQFKQHQVSKGDSPRFIPQLL